MRTFDKSSKLDNVLYDVRGPVVEEAARMGGYLQDPCKC